MNLCLIAPAPPPFGGVANWQQIMVNEIENHKDISLGFINIAANKRPTDGRNFLDRVFFSGYVMFRAYYQLKKIIKNKRPDVVHMTTSGGLGFYRDLLLLNYLKKKAVPSVYHVHFGRSIEYKTSKGRCWRQLTKAVSLADATITIDKSSYEILKPYAKKIEFINNPIPVEEYKKFEKTATNTIVYLGWIIKTKGVEELLSAFSVFNTRHNNKYNLVLIGPGEKEYIAELKSKYSFDNVKITGEVAHDTAMRKLARARLLLLPSYTEGFPNVILEAMALGKCIIATDVGAVPEMLKNDAGILIKPRNIESIVSALEVAENHALLQKYGENANRRVIQEYDIENTFKKYRSVWVSCLRSKTRSCF